MTKSTPNKEPDFLAQKISSTHKGAAKRCIGSFLDTWKSKHRNYASAKEMLPEFIMFLAKHHAEFKGIKPGMLDLNDSCTRSLYDILYRGVNDMNLRATLKAQEPKVIDVGPEPTYERNWQDKHPGMQEQMERKAPDEKDQIVDAKVDHHS